MYCKYLRVSVTAGPLPPVHTLYCILYMYEIQTFRQSVITKGLLFNDVVMLKK